jgi:hypothetical protein
MKSEMVVLKKQTKFTNEINGTNARTFLSFLTNFNISTNFTVDLNDHSPFSRWLNRLFDDNELTNIFKYLNKMTFNFNEYLKDAKLGISNTSKRALKWSFHYDLLAGESSDQIMASCKELEYDPDEFLLNMSICLSTMSDPFRRKKELSKFDNNIEKSRIKLENSFYDDKKLNSNFKNEKNKNDQNSNDFYVLSFDNYNSSSVSSSSSSSSSPTPTQTSDESEILTDITAQECRQELIQYLFYDQEMNKAFLDGNLNSFLNALDQFFSENKNLILKKNNECSSEEQLNSLCDQILSIYDNYFSFNKNSHQKEESNETEEEEMDQNIETQEEISDKKQESNDFETAKIDPIGPFLTQIFNRLESMPTNSLQINFLITGILSRLAYYPQRLLRAFFLDQDLIMKPNIKSIFQVNYN